MSDEVIIFCAECGRFGRHRLIFMKGCLGIDGNLMKEIRSVEAPSVKPGRVPGGQIAVVIIRVDAFAHPGIAVCVDAGEPVMADLLFEVQV